MVLLRTEGLRRYDLDTDCAATFQDDLLDLGVAGQVQILVLSSGRVNIRMG